MGASHDQFVKYPRTPHLFGNDLRQTRQRWVDLFADYHARIEIVYVEPPLAVVLQQNKRRMKPVPEDAIRELANKTEPPTWAECHRLDLFAG